MEDWIATQVVPGVAAVPVEEETTAVPLGETTAILEFTTEPENQTEWEPAYTPMGTSPLPGWYGLGSGAHPEAACPRLPTVCLVGWGVSLPGICAVSPALTLSGCAAVGNFSHLNWPLGPAAE